MKKNKNSVTFVIKNKKERIVEAYNGLSLMEIAISNNVENIMGACGGSCSCGTCHIKLDQKIFDQIKKQYPLKECEIETLNFISNNEKNSRLACQIIMNNSINKIKIKTIQREE